VSDEQSSKKTLMKQYRILRRFNKRSPCEEKAEKYAVCRGSMVNFKTNI
jgi:hypothetical protein